MSEDSLPDNPMDELLYPPRILVIRLVVENEPDVIAVGPAPLWVDRPFVGEHVIVPGVGLWMPIVSIWVGMRMLQFFTGAVLDTVEIRDSLVEEFEKAGFKHGEAGSSMVEGLDHPDGDDHTGMYI